MSSELVASGGASGLALAIAYVIVQIIKSRSERQVRGSGSITDASTANALLLNTLEAEQSENGKLRERLVAAERRLDEMQVALDSERQQHRLELAAVHRQLDELDATYKQQLEDLRARLAEAEKRYRDGT